MKRQFLSQTTASRLQVLAGPSPRLARQLASRRKGVALIYATLGLATFLGATALVVDMGSLYTRRAQAQRAADAAALAGAWDLKQDADGTAAIATAKNYAALNGYKAANSTVNVTIGTSTGSAAANNQVTVNLQKREPLFFLPAVLALIGAGNRNSSLVGAHATARTEFASARVDEDISGGSDYGGVNGVANPSVFGPDSLYEYGDAYSPNTTDGTTVNPGRGDDKDAGTAFPGYLYKFNIPANYRVLNGTSDVQLELFDPDCYVSDPANSLADWDELHNGNGANNVPTVTKYQLFSPSGTLVAEAQYGGDASNPADVDANLKWTTPSGFTFNLDDPDRGTGTYTIRVKSLSGVSENGFQFRAGPKRTDPNSLRLPTDTATWEQNYNRGSTTSGPDGNGTSFSAVGKTPFNFTTTGTVTVKLGFVPEQQPGGQILIDKFDTDVGAKSINYYYLKQDGTRVDIAKPGTLSGNGTWQVDTLTVGTDVPNYPTGPTGGGTWYAVYEAGAYDTSTWSMSYTGVTRTNPQVRLVD